MRETRITLPELVLVAGTRAALGAGLGLLLADRLPADERRAVGWTLFLVGALTTIPLAMEVLGGQRISSAEHRSRIQESDFEPAKASVFGRRSRGREPRGLSV
jgi:hypothetical protein